MGRHKVLTDFQAAEVQRRMAAGEPTRAIARDFPVSETTLRRNFSSRTEKIKSVASKLVAVEGELADMDVPSQVAVRSLADNMKAMAGNLARLARAGSATAVQLAELAQDRAKGVKLKEPKDGSRVDKAVLDDVNALNFAAGRAAAPALRLAAIAQGRELPPEDPEGGDDIAAYTDAQLDYLESLGEEKEGA